MKRYILAIATAAVALPAVAADLPSKSRPVAPSVLAPQSAASWTGFYAGVNGGYGWANDTRSDVLAGGGWWTPAGGGLGQQIRPSGWLAGLQLGYNWQVDPRWVVGVEVQGDMSGLGKSDRSAFNVTNSGIWNARTSSTLTATARLGYSLGNVLPYIKAGYGGANLKSTMIDGGTASSLVHSQWRNGWALGAGVDYALTANWIVGVEYSYLGLGSQTWAGLTAGPAIAERIQDKLNISQLLARVNYKF